MTKTSALLDVGRDEELVGSRDRVAYGGGERDTEVSEYGSGD